MSVKYKKRAVVCTACGTVYQLSHYDSFACVLYGGCLSSAPNLETLIDYLRRHKVHGNVRLLATAGGHVQEIENLEKFSLV